MKKRLCITGGIACGKSLAGSMLAGLGVPVIDADQVAHDLLGPGAPLTRRVAAAFGRGVLRRDGSLDRGVLGRLVFADRAQRLRLNRLVHPAVKRRLARWCRGRRGWCAVLVPLVYEADWAGAWDWIVCVAAPQACQLARLRARGLSAAAARARLAAQWPLEEKMRRADFVVFNSGSRNGLRRQVTAVLSAVKKQPEV